MDSPVNLAHCKSEDIISKVKTAIEEFFKMDFYLLKNDLSEQSITHKLAEHLQAEFFEYHVDCEYNGNCDDDRGRKRISILTSERNKTFKDCRNKSQIASKRVFPDIIIHKRGLNTNNLCVIEVKKSSNSQSFDYDYLKLRAYTGNSYGNDLSYKIGVFLLLHASSDIMMYRIETFIDGERTAEFEFRF